MALQPVLHVIQNIHDNLNPVQGIELQEKQQNEICGKAA